MSRSFVIAACACCIAACRDSHPSHVASNTRCPTADELVHGRELGPQTRAAYAVTTRRCVADGWSERAIRCVRDASNFDDEDRCLDDLLTAAQQAGLAKALGELAARQESALTAAIPEKAGVAGLLLVEHAGSYTLRNDWFEITFPGKPSLIETTDGTPAKAQIPTTVALFDDGPSAYSVVVHSIPADVAYDPARALVDSRDELLEGAAASLIADKPADVGGIPGRHVMGRGGTEAAPLHLEALLAYDARHRVMVVASAMTRSTTGLDPRGGRMLASLTFGAPGD